MYTRIQCVGGLGPQKDKHLSLYLTIVYIFRWRHFAILHCLLWVLSFYGTETACLSCELSGTLDYRKFYGLLLLFVISRWMFELPCLRSRCRNSGSTSSFLIVVRPHPPARIEDCRPAKHMIIIWIIFSLLPCKRLTTKEKSKMGIQDRSRDIHRLPTRPPSL